MGSLNIVLVGLALASGGTAPVSHSPAESGLRDLAKRRRLPLGAAMPVFCLRGDADGGKFTAVGAREFDMLELENELKPPSIWTGPHTYRFDDVDFVVGAPGQEGWAQRNRMKLRGHVLVYARDEGYTLPQWLRASEKDLTKEQAADLLHEYIRALAGRYRGKVAMWDVANEAIDDRPNSNPFNLRDSFWFRKLGPEFLVLAFKWAHEADPKAQLYYNEYGIEGGGPKARHMLELAKWLKDQGAPITGLGLQYHIDCRTKVEPGDGHYALIDDIRKLRLSYMITELDVAVPAKPLPPGDPNRGMEPKDPADLDRQAEVYAAVFRMALASKNCRGVQLWGFTDRHSWIPGFSRGRDGAALIFDADYKPKPAYAAIAATLGH